MEKVNHVIFIVLLIIVVIAVLNLIKGMNKREKNKNHLVRYAKWYLYLSMFFILIFTGGVIWEGYWTVKYHYYYYSVSLFYYALSNLGVSWLLYFAFLAIIDLSPKQESKDKTFQKEGHEE